MREDWFEKLREGWVEKEVELASFDASTLAAEADKLRATVRRRNAREHVAGLVVVIAFGWAAIAASDPVAKLGALLEVLGAISVSYTLARRGRASPGPSQLAEDCLSWQRAELLRERDLLASVWRWYLGPLVPGQILLLLSGARRADSPADIAALCAVALSGSLLFASIAASNQRAAQKLDEQLSALPKGGIDEP